LHRELIQSALILIDLNNAAVAEPKAILLMHDDRNQYRDENLEIIH